MTTTAEIDAGTLTLDSLVALATLSIPQREAIVDHVILGHSFVQIAARMKISRERVRQYEQEGLERLAALARLEAA